MNEVIGLKSQIPETLSTEDFQSLLKSFDEGVQKQEVVRHRDSKKSRREVWKQNIDSIPMEKMIEVDKAMKEYVETYLLDRLDFTDGPRDLEQAEVDKLAEEYLQWEQINDLFQARYQQFREIVFGVLTVRKEREIQDKKVDSDTPPEQLPGALTSEKYGVAFKREGGKRKNPSVDWNVLKEELGEEKFNELLCERVDVPEQIIPAHTEFTPSGERLMEALHTNGVDLEIVREALIPGAWTTPRFVPRKI